MDIDILEDLLGRIEQGELRSLQWGFLDGTTTEAELDRLASDVFASLEGDPESLVEDLISARLIFETPLGSGRYRSRFAEGVRLLGYLKQLFPGKAVAGSPNLVSDFRVDARPRQFPRRNVSAVQALETLSGTPSWSPFRRQVATALLQQSGRDISLSAFQLRAAQRVLSESAADAGVVVSSGTGSGKTLAFYLPALTAVADWIDGSYWTKAVAVYPRIELLKDQFSEAFRLARLTDTAVAAAGKRRVTLGALYGGTPRRAAESDVATAWARRGSGYICPFLVCPSCGQEMIWAAEALSQGAERLNCVASGCGVGAGEDEIRLTRESLAARPPDLLFTTTEILNQRLSDPGFRPLLGVQPDRSRRARLMLLDEIHTYGGTSGAQTAMVVRRWRHAIASSVRFVGLSATLRDAPDFFAQLTGVPAASVTEVTPAADELERRGMQYQVILRGDPVSGTSLLSTSIQASFLLARLMDPQPGTTAAASSNGLFGHRVFVFTDDLDVTNRLFDDLRDAEGYDIFGKPRPGARPLAALRAGGDATDIRRQSQGQNWRVVERIRGDLTQRLVVGRTSSQDAGVNRTADIIVATASLEVGFDDPLVGAVLQHKAPRQLAQFVQRKGRAGRPTGMRPWMVTVLSDYGRDRLAYQAYDQLFDPALPPQRLPIHNTYVLRMQAVFAFIDWLAATNERRGFRMWWWRVLAGPSENEWAKKHQARAIETIESLLDGDAELADSLRGHLRRALGLQDDAELESILWEPPRPLLLEVLPTLLRRLQTAWSIPEVFGGKTRRDLASVLPTVHPLPDFVPANLFSDLNLPEVTVVLPPATVHEDETVERVPIVQAMRQLVPGRVTRRFAPSRGGLSHWVPIPDDVSDSYDVPISTYAERHELVTYVPVELNGDVRPVPCFRPWHIRMEKVPKRIGESSNAFLNWQSQIIAPTPSVRLETSLDPVWSSLVPGVDAYLHSFSKPLTIRRFAPSARATILQDKNQRNVHVRFRTDEGDPATVGFEQEADGLAFRLSLPSGESLARRAEDARSLPSWRTSYFRDRLLSDVSLKALANRFQVDWLCQIYLSALANAVLDAGDRRAGLQILHESAAVALETAMEGVLGTSSIEDSERLEGTDNDASPAVESRLKERLLGLIHNPEVIDRLRAASSELWDPDADAWGSWLLARVHETLAEAALLAALATASHHADEDSLLVDLSDGLLGMSERVAGHDVWLTESTLGGAGVADAVARAFAQDPRAFFRAMEAALAESDLETTALGLESFLTYAVNDERVAFLVDRVRSQTTHDARDRARADLHRGLGERGLGVDQGLAVGLNHRLLRQGTSRQTDAVVLELLSTWQDWERQLGISLDLRIFASVAAARPGTRSAIQDLIGTNAPSLAGVSLGSVLASVLWARPAEVRGRTLRSYSAFRESGRTDPALVRELLLEDATTVITFGAEGWRVGLQKSLALGETVRLEAARGEEVNLQAALLELLAQPIDAGFLQLYPSIDRVNRDEHFISVTLILRELV